MKNAPNPHLTQPDQIPKNQFLTRNGYEGIKERLLQGLNISACEETAFINTVLGIDVLVLFGELYKKKVVTGHDVTLIGEDLACRFCEDGYSFALCKLFEAAGRLICYKRMNEGAERVVKTAFEGLRASRSHDAEVYMYFAVSLSFLGAKAKCTKVELNFKGLKAMIKSYNVINQNRKY